MQITRIEFVLLVAVFSGVIIFCPEALVLLRNLCVWCLIIWAAWYGYDQWESSARVRQGLQSLLQARSLADVTTLLWGETRTAAMEWVNNKASYARHVVSRVWTDFYSRFTYILSLTRSTSSFMPSELWFDSKSHNILIGQPSNLSANTPPSTTTPNQPSTDLSSSSESQVPRTPKYYAIFVTKPPVHRYGEFSDNFCTPEDKPCQIQWDVASTKSIPPLIPSLKFRRHWLFGLIKDSVWESKSLTLVQKLSDGLFWDHCGDEKREKSGCKITLGSNYIRRMNGIYNLGIVTDSEDVMNRCSNCEFSHFLHLH